MKKLPHLLIGITLFAGALLYAVPHVLAQTAQQTVCESIGSVSGANGCDPPATSPSVDSLVATTINILSWVIGIIAVVMVIIGAAKYMTSGGDGNAVASAKKTILYALIGLMMAAVAQALVRFVLNKATH